MMRSNPTNAETHMWSLLRKAFPEARFRRQVPIRHYIADFVSHRSRLVIEIDGGQHGSAQDVVRDRLIEAEGYRVVRFWNNDVLGNGEGCMAQLSVILAQGHPHPTSASPRLRESKPACPSPIEGEEA